MAENEEVCGFIDVKLSRKTARNRSLAAWKTWKRQWCAVKRMGAGVEMRFNCCIGSGSATLQNEKRSSIAVPIDALVCRVPSRSKQFAFGIFANKERKPLLRLSGRSETETQQWMADIRQLLRPRRHRSAEGSYGVSLIDNAHSTAAGLSGLHGDLIANRTGVFIEDPYSGDIVQSFKWKEFKQFHLTTVGRPEDVKRICVIYTTSDFRSGRGELHVFCLDAGKLLQDLITQGRGPKHRLAHHKSISLSEGDLRVSMTGDENAHIFSVLKEKNASSLSNIEQRAFLSRRSPTTAQTKPSAEVTYCNTQEDNENCKGSGRTRAINNVYQSGPADTTNLCPDVDTGRRISNISVASGIYEEIIDSGDAKPPRLYSNLYEDPEELLFGSCGIMLQPPPLPPRQRHGSESTAASSNSDDGSDSIGNSKISSAATGCNTMSTFEERVNNVHEAAIDTSDYIPMSPRLMDITFRQHDKRSPVQDDVYMVMR